MDGTIDLCNGGFVAGWAVEDGLPAKLEILVNSKVVARIRCAVSRPDLALQGRTPNAGFNYEFASRLSVADVVSVRSLDGAELRNSPISPEPPPPPELRGEVAICSASGVSGWAAAAGSPVELEILVNSKRVGRALCDKPRPHLEALGYGANPGFAFAFAQPLDPSDQVMVRLLDGPPLAAHPVSPAPRLGAFEFCTAAKVGGWAVENGRPAALDVLVNGALAARIQCDLKKPELPDHAIPESAGFSFQFARPLAASDVVSICFADGSALRDSPRSPQLHEGNIDSCRASRVSGWAAYAGQPAELDIFVNHERVVRIRCDGERPDLAAAGAPLDAGFAYRFLPSTAPGDEISVRYIDGTHVHGSPRRPEAAAPGRLKSEWQYGCKVVILLGPRESDLERCANVLEQMNFKTDEATAAVPVHRRGRWQMVDFHERALELLTGRGDGASRPIDPLALSDNPAAQNIVDEMEEWLHQRGSRFPQCFIRDVRSARLLPLWNGIFDGADLRPFYVLCIGDPARDERGSPSERRASAARWTEFYSRALIGLNDSRVCVLPEEDWREGGERNIARLKEYLDVSSLAGAAAGRANAKAAKAKRRDKLGDKNPTWQAEALYRLVVDCAPAFQLDDRALAAARELVAVQRRGEPTSRSGAASPRDSARYTNVRPAWIEIARAGGLFGMVTIKQSLTTQYDLREAFAIYQLIMRYAAASKLVEKTPAPLRRYASQNAILFHEIDAGGEHFSIDPPEVIGEGNHVQLKGVSRPIYLSCIAGARVRGYSSFVEVGDLALFDDEPEELARIEELLEFDPAIFRAEKDSIWIAELKDRSYEVRLDEAFNLIGCRTRVFGHWMWEYLPKFMTASMSGKLPSAPVLIDSNMPPTHREVLEMLLPTGAGIIELAPHVTARVDRLWCAPSQMRLPLLVKITESFKWDHEASPPDRFGPIIREMARRIMSKVNLPGRGERIYLARKPSSHRKLVNHAIVEAVAQARGFRIVYPETMSFAEQAATLHGARYVIAPEGSALFLAFLAKPGAKICILEHPETASLAIYNGLFQQIGVETVVFTGPFVRFDKDWPHMSDYRIDESAFARFLGTWLGSAAR